MAEDRELVAAALAGGPEAFAPIVERYQDAVFGIAVARLGDFHEAQDITQEVFLKAFRALGRLRNPERLGAWLRRMALCRCVDRLRARREAVPIEDDGGTSSELAPDEHLQRQEVRQVVLDAIGRLGRAQRETVTLFYVNGYSLAEVAGMQAVPEGTIKRRLHDARERLKDELIGMVENVLKSEAPKEDFAGRVFALLNQHGLPLQERSDIWFRSGEAAAQLQRLCEEDTVAAMEGFARAMASRHSFTRLVAIRTLRKLNPEQIQRNLPVVIDVFKCGLRDTNKRVRVSACIELRNLSLPAEIVRKELLPLAAELLRSPIRSSRSGAVWFFRSFPHDAPMDDILRVLADWPEPRTNRERWGLRWMKGWIREILDARAKKQ